MPNLDHDPKNPSDLLGRPIKDGDIVAWGTTYGRSPAVAVCRIHKIRFVYKPQPYGKNVECEQWQADDYTLVLEPIKSTGHVTSREYVSGGWIDPADGQLKYTRPLAKPKLKSVRLVKNIVKLEPLDV